MGCPDFVGFAQQMCDEVKGIKGVIAPKVDVDVDLITVVAGGKKVHHHHHHHHHHRHHHRPQPNAPPLKPSPPKCKTLNCRLSPTSNTWGLWRILTNISTFYYNLSIKYMKQNKPPPKPKYSGGQLVVESLKAEKTDTVFGLIGSAAMEVFVYRARMKRKALLFVFMIRVILFINMRR